MRRISGIWGVVLATTVLVVGACGGDGDGRSMNPLSAGGDGGDGGEDVATSGESDDPGLDADDGSSSGAEDGADTDDPADGGAPAASMCTYEATDFGGARKLLDVDAGSDEVLTFIVPGIPDPSTITSATLHYDAEDADHPGQEGVIRVNGGGNLQLPADASQDNVESHDTVDITGLLLAGENRVEFGAGTFADGTYYWIWDVRVDLEVEGQSCPEPPPLPDGEYREMGYLDATYTMRHNWVLRCDGPPYAFTAYSNEHLDKDCDGLYAPDGTRKGKAIFTFEDVAPGNYSVQIESFHSASRNPNGALFIVDGVANRVDQVVDAADAGFYTADWGELFLSGTIDVVLDSEEDNNASDSVGLVMLVPTSG